MSRMQEDRLPDETRLRWGGVALAATRRKAEWEGSHALDRAVELAAVRGYLIQQFGPGRGGDPAALCREALALIDLTPARAAAEAASWRDLPRSRIQHLRRIKLLLPWMALVRPHLPDHGLLAEAVDAWEQVRPQLP
ncbi:hypothetical protein ABZZ20_19810 [Streptomyces sp. NPDC006430]|uniref:hypothetical protein n=1 Tax=Streptomyces sp. NPDC006430 TaxID=3154299 RepID=UPI0033B8A4BE